jgi:hypothetical protein
LTFLNHIFLYKVENDNDIMNGMMNDTKKPDEPGFTENDINLMPGTIDLDGWGFD